MQCLAFILLRCLGESSCCVPRNVFKDGLLNANREMRLF